MDRISRKYFDRQSAFSSEHQAYTDCPFYPCHELPSGQDQLNCLFCYCPFYPCENRVGNGLWIRCGKKKIWDCTPCTFIHRKDVSARLFGLMFDGKTARQTERILRREFRKPGKRP